MDTPAQPPNQPAIEISSQKVSVRALLIGSLAVVVVCWIVAQAELVTGQINIGYLQLPAAAVGMLVVLVWASNYLRRYLRSRGLTPQELVTIYCMMVVGAMISSHGMMEKLIPTLNVINYTSTPSNNWQTIYWPHIKRWLVPWDPKGEIQQLVSKRFFEGLRFGEAVPWRPWVVPMLAWTAMILLLFTAFLCLSALMRRQWVDNEKLSFPLVQLPLEMAKDQGGGLMGNPMMWGGFAIPAVVFTINGFHNWYPAVPQIALSFPLNQYLTTRPWSDVFYTPITISFAAIGFFYFLPTELLLSLWIFFVGTRVQDVLASSAGMTMDSMPMYPTHLFIGYQIVGAYLVLTGYFIATARPHIKSVLRTVFTRGGVDDSQEMIPYRVAFWGLTLSYVGAAAWWALAGMSLWLAFFELGVYLFVIALVMTRSVAEAGMLMTETSFRPVDLYTLVAPKASLGSANLTMLAFMDAVLLRDQRNLILTGFLDGLKLVDGVNLNRRSFLKTLILGILVAVVAAGIIQVRLPYVHPGGAVNMYYWMYQGSSQTGFNDYASAAQGSMQHYDWRAPVFFIVGIGFTLFLSFMRVNYSWWPLHPLGYALSASWSMIVYWFPALVAWVIKAIIQRYGGMASYVRFRPFFFGLILGEVMMAIFWACLSTWAQIPAPWFPWP